MNSMVSMMLIEFIDAHLGSHVNLKDNVASITSKVQEPKSVYKPTNSVAHPVLL